jgi:hypothetical protein
LIFARSENSERVRGIGGRGIGGRGIGGRGRFVAPRPGATLSHLVKIYFCSFENV